VWWIVLDGFGLTQPELAAQVQEQLGTEYEVLCRTPAAYLG